MHEDPEKRDFDPAVDRVWLAEVTLSLSMYVTAATKGEAGEVVGAHWRDELGNIMEDYTDFTQLKEPLVGSDWNSLPWGRVNFRGKELGINELIALVKNPPPPDPRAETAYDTHTILMPFADAPPPLRPE